MENDILQQILDEIKYLKIEANRWFKELGAGLSRLQADITVLEESVEKLETGYAGLKTDTDFMRSSLIIIENDHDAKLCALFDGQIAINERLDRHEAILNENTELFEQLKND